MHHPDIYQFIQKIKSGGKIYCGLEGPDGVGKSSVATRVGEITGIQKFHRRSLAFGNPDGYNPNASLGMEWAALKLCANFGLSLLEERTFLGFAIYANHPEFTPAIAKELLEIVDKINAVYIFLQVSPKTIHKRLGLIGEYLPSVDRDILRYEDFANNPPKPYKHLDIRIVDAEKTIEEVAWEIVSIMKEKII